MHVHFFSLGIVIIFEQKIFQYLTFVFCDFFYLSLQLNIVKPFNILCLFVPRNDIHILFLHNANVQSFSGKLLYHALHIKCSYLLGPHLKPSVLVSYTGWYALPKGWSSFLINCYFSSCHDSWTVSRAWLQCLEAPKRLWCVCSSILSSHPHTLCPSSTENPKIFQEGKNVPLWDNSIFTCRFQQGEEDLPRP